MDLNSVVILLTIFMATEHILLCLIAWWIGFRPIINTLKKKIKPGKWSDVFKIRADGVVFCEVMQNPKEIRFSDQQNQLSSKAKVGCQITETYHRNGDFGNPAHFCFEGESKNSNLLEFHKPSVDSELTDATMVQMWHAGAMDMLAELKQQSNIFSLQNMVLVLSIVVTVAMVYMTMQNGDLLKELIKTTATIAANTAPIIPQGAEKILTG